MSDTEKKVEMHEKHKQRLRERFLREGNFNNFYDHEILEMLLSYAVVRKNTNEMAHRLIDRFKTLDGVFEADPEELQKIDGVGERCATLLKMQYELFRAYSASKYKLKNKKYSSELASAYFKSMLFGKRDEFMYLMCIDDKDNIINTRLIGNGFLGSVEIEFREVLKEVLRVNAYGVVVAHNHPNGILKASEADIHGTKVLGEILRRVSVKFIDHFIVADNNIMSIMNDRFIAR